MSEEGITSNTFKRLPSEKVLGFLEEDAGVTCEKCKCNYSVSKECPCCLGKSDNDVLDFYRKDQVPVVSVEWLEKFCKERIIFLRKMEIKAEKVGKEYLIETAGIEELNDLLEAVKKQVKKE